jgi:predicted HicB family RNase H-like nuclease
MSMAKRQSERQSVHVRLPVTLLGELHEGAKAEGVSVNTLIATLLAGSVGFDLTKAAA